MTGKNGGSTFGQACLGLEYVAGRSAFDSTGDSPRGWYPWHHRSMKVSVSPPEDYGEFLDSDARLRSFSPRALVLHTAVRLLLGAQLGPAYEDAFMEWKESGNASSWDFPAGDGLKADAPGLKPAGGSGSGQGCGSQQAPSGGVPTNDSANGPASQLEREVVIVVPATSSLQRIYPFHVLLPSVATGLRHDSKSQAEQVLSVPVRRLGASIGGVPSAIMAELDEALRLHLAL